MRKYPISFVFLFILFLASCDNNKVQNYDPFFWGTDEITYDVFTKPIDFTELLTLHDNEDGEIIITLDMINDDAVDFDSIGIYTVIYSYTDSGGSTTVFEVTVNIIDNENPVIILVGEDCISIILGEEFTQPEFILSDNYDSNFTIQVNGDEIDPNIPGTYHLTYSIYDSSGNTSNEINYTVYILADVAYDFNIGDEVHMSGYYTRSFDGGNLLAEIGFFKVQEFRVGKEFPIGLSTLESDEIVIWTQDGYLVNREDFEAIEVVDLAVPLLHQFDYSGYLTGTNLTISGYGCAITALTMVVNYMNGTAYTPEETNADLVMDGLVYWINTKVEKYDFISPNYYPSYEQYRTLKLFTEEEAYNLLQMHIKDKLDDGIPVLVKIKGNTTHYVVATGYGYDIYGQIYIKINDPGSSYRFYLSDVTAKYQYFYEGFIYYTD